MKVDEIMTKKLELIHADAPIYDAIESMIDKRIRSLLVKPRDEKDVYGVITVRDIVYKVLGKNLDLNKTKVGEIHRSLWFASIEAWMLSMLSI